MNRLLALVAVASLGTGCIVEDRCDVRITWPDFEAADGGSASCSTAGVDAVEIWVDGGGGPRVTVPCDPQRFADLTVSPGFHSWSVEGIRYVDVGGEVRRQIVNRHPFDLDDSCGFGSIETRPAQGRAVFDYRFYTGGVPIDPQVCRDGGSYLWLSVYDEIANDLAVEIDAGNFPTQYQCGPDVQIALPIGSFILDWMEERAPNGALAAAGCTNVGFDVLPGASTTVDVALDLDATSRCVSQFLMSSEPAARSSTPRIPAGSAPPALKTLAP